MLVVYTAEIVFCFTACFITVLHLSITW